MLKDVTPEEARARVDSLIAYMRESHPAVLAEIDATRDLSFELKGQLKLALEAFVA